MSRLRQWRQGAEYQAVRGALFLAGSLPLGITRAFGAAVGTLAFALRIRREVSVDNIVRGLGLTPREATRIARRSYQNLGRSFMEFAAQRRWSQNDVLELVHLDGMEHIRHALEAGRGAIMVSGHFGNWETAGAALRGSGLPLSFLVGEQTNGRVDDVINDLRRAQQIGIITRASALKKVLTALRNNEVIALLADQDARKAGVVVEFLGRPASTVRGPAMFAIRADCPIVPFSIRRDGKAFMATVEPALWPDPALDEEASVVALTQGYTDALARAVRAHPEEYFWPHRRWKSTSSQATRSQGATGAA
ncbi:MAG TPA: lysophospholipid acyltransferase family protein [Candidatus Krumholzibacteria bacterium]|nr:lysophospholipid acyltransferase family protein [Candidatus Krumholzibacteria bacterium]